ncbi:MAG: NUDIX domain-containing protein [Oscillochloris sp.]|nr:NUDIX domain-containing protein [Oscillochloris sp.]
MKTVYAVGAVVIRTTSDATIELLLIRKRGGDWSLPKGARKRNESDIRAVIREVYEETGIAADVLDLVAVASYRIKKRSGPRKKIVSYYLLRAVAGEPRPDQREKIVDAVWIPLDDSLRRLRRSRLQTIVRAAQTMIGP